MCLITRLRPRRSDGGSLYPEFSMFASTVAKAMLSLLLDSMTTTYCYLLDLQLLSPALLFFVNN